MPERQGDGIKEASHPKHGTVYSIRWWDDGIRRYVWHQDRALIQQVAALVQKTSYPDALHKAVELGIQVHTETRSGRKKRSSTGDPSAAAASLSNPPGNVPPAATAAAPPPQQSSAAAAVVQAPSRLPVRSPQNIAGGRLSAGPQAWQPPWAPSGAAAAAGGRGAGMPPWQGPPPMQRGPPAPRPAAGHAPGAAGRMAPPLYDPRLGPARRPMYEPHDRQAPGMPMPHPPWAQHSSSVPRTAAAAAPGAAWGRHGQGYGTARAAPPRPMPAPRQVQTGNGMDLPAAKRHKQTAERRCQGGGAADAAAAAVSGAGRAPASTAVEPPGGAVAAAAAAPQAQQGQQQGYSTAVGALPTPIPEQRQVRAGPEQELPAAKRQKQTAEGRPQDLGAAGMAAAAIPGAGWAPASSAVDPPRGAVAVAAAASAQQDAVGKAPGHTPQDNNKLLAEDAVQMALGSAVDSACSTGSIAEAPTAAAAAAASSQAAAPSAPERDRTPESSCAAVAAGSRSRAGSRSAAAGGRPDPIPWAWENAEAFGLLEPEDVKDLEMLDRRSRSFHNGETAFDVQPVLVKRRSTGEDYPIVIKTYRGRTPLLQRQLERLLRVGIPTWRAMGSEVVRVVGWIVERHVNGAISWVRVYMVHKGRDCKDLGHLLDPAGTTELSSNIFLRAGTSAPEGAAAEELVVVECHGCLVPVQAILARMVDILYIIHEERRMVTRDMRPENVLLPRPGRVGDLNSQEPPSQEVQDALVDDGVEVTFCDLDGYAKRARREPGAQQQQQPQEQQGQQGWQGQEQQQQQQQQQQKQEQQSQEEREQVQEGQQQQQQQQAQQSQQEQEQKQEGQQQQQQQKEQQPLGKQEPEQEGQQQQEVQQREEEEDGSEAEGGKEEEAAEQALLALPGTTTCKAASVCITLPGTYAYMAPDVYDMATCRRGMTEAQAIIAASQLAKDPACDIWSLGAVVMEMIVRPATPDSKMEPGNASYRLLREPTTRRAVLGEGGMGVQEALLHFLDRCLELDPAQRATISELKQMEVCQPKYRKALSWPHITRQLPKPMVK